METLFGGIPLGDVSTSMTINSPAAILLAFYLAVGEEQGVPAEHLRGTIQTDILKEYIAQKEYIFPPEPSMRLVTDMVEFCSRELPLWHPISISGYHIREAGLDGGAGAGVHARDGFTYVEWAVERGLDVDEFAPRLSFFFNAHLTSSRRSPSTGRPAGSGRGAARPVRRPNPRSLLMRFHTQTAGVSLTAQQPEVNIVRTAIEALAAVLGGTQTLHTNSFDEALALPTEDAVRIALRTQQVIAHETGVVNTVDPLGGSYYVEQLTNGIEGRHTSTSSGSRSSAGWSRRSSRTSPREIADAAFRYQAEVEAESGSSSASTATSPTTRQSSRSSRSTRRSSRSRSSAYRRSGPARLGCGRAAARRLEARRRPRRRQPDAADPRRRPRLRHHGRDLRRVARGLGHLARDARLLRRLS